MYAYGIACTWSCKRARGKRGARAAIHIYIHIHARLHIYMTMYIYVTVAVILGLDPLRVKTPVLACCPKRSPPRREATRQDLVRTSRPPREGRRAHSAQQPQPRPPPTALAPRLLLSQCLSLQPFLCRTIARGFACQPRGRHFGQVLLSFRQEAMEHPERHLR